MASDLHIWADRLLGLHLQAHELGFGHMALRALVVFVAGLILVRFADRRLLGNTAGFDVLLWVILGSVISRGVNGQAAFFPSLGAGAVLIVLHRLLSAAAFHSHRTSVLVKGSPRSLVRDGKIISAELKRHHITLDDLDENLRLSGNLSTLNQVAEARIERNGSISVVRKDD